MHGSKLWPKSSFLKPLPPKERRMPGRPVLKRKKHPTEKEDRSSKKKKSPSTTVEVKGTRSMTCSRCQEKGHNIRKCTNEKVEPPAKTPKPKGRPKLNIDVPSSSRGGRGNRGRRGGSTSRVPRMVGVSYEDGEAMIHHVNGSVTPAWPPWVLPKSIQDSLNTVRDAVGDVVAAAVEDNEPVAAAVEDNEHVAAVVESAVKATVESAVEAAVEDDPFEAAVEHAVEDDPFEAAVEHDLFEVDVDVERESQLVTSQPHFDDQSEQEDDQQENDEQEDDELEEEAPQLVIRRRSSERIRNNRKTFFDKDGGRTIEKVINLD